MSHILLMKTRANMATKPLLLSGDVGDYWDGKDHERGQKHHNYVFAI